MVVCMNQPNHTPGPWRLDQSRTSHCVTAPHPLPHLARRVTVAHLEWVPHDHRQRDANGRLLTAAPDLLDFAQAFLSGDHDTETLTEMAQNAVSSALDNPSEVC